MTDVVDSATVMGIEALLNPHAPRHDQSHICTANAATVITE